MTSRNPKFTSSTRRALSVAGATLSLLLATAGTASAQSNPLDGVKPNLDVWGPTMGGTWGRVASGIWGLLFAGATINLLVSLYRIKQAKNRGYQSELTDSMDSARVAAVAVGALAGAGVVVGAILFLVNG